MHTPYDHIAGSSSSSLPHLAVYGNNHDLNHLLSLSLSLSLSVNSPLSATADYVRTPAHATSSFLVGGGVGCW